MRYWLGKAALSRKNGVTWPHCVSTAARKSGGVGRHLPGSVKPWKRGGGRALPSLARVSTTCWPMVAARSRTPRKRSTVTLFICVCALNSCWVAAPAGGARRSKTALPAPATAAVSSGCMSGFMRAAASLSGMFRARNTSCTARYWDRWSMASWREDSLLVTWVACRCWRRAWLHGVTTSSAWVGARKRPRAATAGRRIRMACVWGGLRVGVSVCGCVAWVAGWGARAMCTFFAKCNNKGEGGGR